MERLISNVISILTATKTSAPAGSAIKSIKNFYFGDPVLIPASWLPAVIVMPQSSVVKARGVSTDEEQFSIKIKLVQNQKDYMGDSTETSSDMALFAIRLFEERDGTSFDKIKTNSIIGALRNNYSLTPSSGQLAVHWNWNYALSYDFVNMGDWVAFETTCSIDVLRISDRF